MSKTQKRKTLQAINFSQNGSDMLITSMKANDLINYTKVETFNPGLQFDDEDQGYQRLPSSARVKRLGNFLDNNVKQETSFPMPTAILLSDRDVNVEMEGSALSFPIDAKFPIIDGQHRIEGIKHAVKFKKNETLADYSYAVVIMRNMEKISEMKQFKVVNGEAKSVSTGLVNMLLTQIAEKEGIEDNSKERWKVIASRVMKRLNEDPNSIWYDMILMPNDSKYTKSEIKDDPSKKHKRLCGNISFHQSLRSLIAYGDEFLWFDKSIDDMEYAENNLVEMINAFWSAFAEVIQPAFKKPNDYVIQRTTGVFTLHHLLKRMMRDLQRTHQLLTSSESYKKMIDGGHYKTIDAWFWNREKNVGTQLKAANFGSQKGFKQLYEIIDGDLTKPKS